MNRLSALSLSFSLSAVLVGPLVAESLTYRETSQGKTTKETATLTRSTEGGLFWETITDKESTTRSGRTADGTLVAMHLEGPEGQWDLKVSGNTLSSSGSLNGKALSGSLALNGRVWGLGFDQPLRWAVLRKQSTPLTFLMVNPNDLAKPQEMVLTPDGKDSVEGRPALRFKLGLPGAMALFWSATIWADPTTGEQVQYKGNKGPGTPDVVLVIERN